MEQDKRRTSSFAASTSPPPAVSAATILRSSQQQLGSASSPTPSPRGGASAATRRRSTVPASCPPIGLQDFVITASGAGALSPHCPRRDSLFGSLSNAALKNQTLSTARSLLPPS